MATAFLTVYSPKTIDPFSLFINFIGVPITFGLVIVFVLIFHFSSAAGRLSQALLKRIWVSFGVAIALLLSFEVIYSFKSATAQADNYQNIRNYDKAKKIMGVLSPLEVKALSWPGNSLKLEHFDVLHFSINGHELKTNMRVDWNRSQKADMPLCYQDDLRELLTPYVGKQVTITYYNFVSNFHPTDDSRNLCIVDLAVKHN